MTRYLIGAAAIALMAGGVQAQILGGNAGLGGTVGGTVGSATGQVGLGGAAGGSINAPVDRVGDTLGRTTGTVRDRTADTVDRARDRTADTVESTRDRSQRIADRTSDRVRGAADKVENSRVDTGVTGAAGVNTPNRDTTVSTGTAAGVGRDRVAASTGTQVSSQPNPN